jgi:hypothetical protein
MLQIYVSASIAWNYNVESNIINNQNIILRDTTDQMDITIVKVGKTNQKLKELLAIDCTCLPWVSYQFVSTSKIQIFFSEERFVLIHSNSTVLNLCIKSDLVLGENSTSFTLSDLCKHSNCLNDHIIVSPDSDLKVEIRPLNPFDSYSETAFFNIFQNQCEKILEFLNDEHGKSFSLL